MTSPHRWECFCRRVVRPEHPCNTIDNGRNKKKGSAQQFERAQHAPKRFVNLVNVVDRENPHALSAA